MAATKSQAEQCDPNALDTLVTEWQTAHDQVETGLDKAGNDFRQSIDFWTGKTGDRARETTHRAVTAGRSFTADLTTAITALTQDRESIWSAKNRAIQSITSAVAAKYDVAEDGGVEPSEAAKLAALASSDDAKDQTTALAALQKYGKDTFEKPIKSALADLGGAIEAAAGHIQNAFPNSGGVSAIAAEAPGELDPRKKVIGEQGKQDGETIADGKLSGEERQRILDHLRATGLTDAQLATLQSGGNATVPQSTMDYLTNLYDKAGRDGLLTLSDSLEADGSPQSRDLRQYLSNGMLTLSNEHVVARDSQGKVTDRGGFGKLNSEIREIVGTRPNIAGAPDSNTRDLPDDYRSGFFGPKVDHQSGIKDYTADLDRFSDFLGSSKEGYQPGERFGVELGRQAAHQAWILDHGGYGNYEGTKLPDREALQHTENSAQNLLGVAARNHDANYALLTGDGGEELFGKNTPGQSWHPYDRDAAIGTLLIHEWKDDGKAFGSMVEWMGEDAFSPDTERAERAGRTAGAFADLISNDNARNGVNVYDSLMNIPGHDGQSLGEVNPRATQAIAAALAPYAGDIVGAPATLTGTHGFPSESIGPVDAVRIFSIMDGDPTAGDRMNGAALLWAEQIDRHFAESAVQPGPEQVELGHYSGRLRGVVDAGINAHVGDLNLDETNRAKALSDQRAAAYGVAQNLIGTTGVAGPVGGIGGPIAQAISEYYKGPLTGVDPDYSGHIPNARIDDPTHGRQFDLQQAGTDGNRRYNMLRQLVESGRVNPYMLPPDVQKSMLSTSAEGTVQIMPYASVAESRESADALDRSVREILDRYGVSSAGQADYLAKGDKAAAIWDGMISAQVIDGQHEFKNLTSGRLAEKGYDKWSRTR